MAIEICTIGFTQSTAERFFGRLKDAGVTRVLDIRLHSDSQLAGFAKAGSPLLPPRAGRRGVRA